MDLKVVKTEDNFNPVVATSHGPFLGVENSKKKILASFHSFFYRYADLMINLMSDDCQYLLLSNNYDLEKYAGPPHAVPSDVIHRLFGKSLAITRLYYY